MKKLIIKYTLEFIVIVVGISLSFYVEKLNEANYKENLKNQSLKRILKNIEVDTEDFEFNSSALKKAIKSSEWIINNELKELSRDSIGFHLNRALYYNTIFVDNQEEYRSLQNSGLIEIIENEDLVVNLQKKYITHEFMKKIEEVIIKKSEGFDEFIYNNTKNKSLEVDELGLPFDRTYTGNKVLPNQIIQRISDLMFYRNFYLGRIENRTKSDSILISEIKSEINLEQ
jgi:hypothetical protein